MKNISVYNCMHFFFLVKVYEQVDLETIQTSKIVGNVENIEIAYSNNNLDQQNIVDEQPKIIKVREEFLLVSMNLKSY